MATEGISAIEMEDDDIKARRNKCAAVMLKGGVCSVNGPGLQLQLTKGIKGKQRETWDAARLEEMSRSVTYCAGSGLVSWALLHISDSQLPGFAMWHIK